MTLQQAVILTLQASVLLIVFGFGLQASGRDLLYLFRRPSLLARSLVAMFVVMPILAVVLVRVLELRQSLEIALVALAISPVPPLLPKKQDTAGGESAYALALMAVVAWQLLRVAVYDWLTLGLAAVSALLLFRFRVNSVWLVLGGAAIGLLSTLWR